MNAFVARARSTISSKEISKNPMNSYDSRLAIKKGIVSNKESSMNDFMTRTRVSIQSFLEHFDLSHLDLAGILLYSMTSNCFSHYHKVLYVVFTVCNLKIFNILLILY